MWKNIDPMAEYLDNCELGDLLLYNAILSPMEERMLLGATGDSVLLSHVDHTHYVHFATEHHKYGGGGSGKKGGKGGQKKFGYG